MNKRNSESRHCQYADGGQVQLGDRVVFDDTLNHDFGRVIAIFEQGTKEARGLRLPNGGFLVKIDGTGLRLYHNAYRDISFIARGSSQDNDIAMVKDFLRGIPYDEDIAKYRYDRYLTGEEIHVGDIVETYGNGDKMQRGRIIKHFLPETKDPEAKDWYMQNGGILIEFDRDGLVGYGPADEELFFVSRGRGQDVRTTRNTCKIVKRVSNSCLLISLVALIFLSLVDVVPWKQASWARVLYSCGIVFGLSLIVSVCCGVKCKRQKGSDKCVSEVG